LLMLKNRYFYYLDTEKKYGLKRQKQRNTTMTKIKQLPWNEVVVVVVKLKSTVKKEQKQKVGLGIPDCREGEMEGFRSDSLIPVSSIRYRVRVMIR